MLPRTDSERPVRENPEGRKGGSVPRVEDPTVCHLRRCSEKDTVAVLPQKGAPPALPHIAWPSGDTGGVAIELRPILQPTSLRARWTPCRDEFRVVRDDRRLVTMGAVLRTRRGQVALWASWRVGTLDAVLPTKGRRTQYRKMRSLDGLAWTARWMVRFRGE